MGFHNNPFRRSNNSSDSKKVLSQGNQVKQKPIAAARNQQVQNAADLLHWIHLSFNFSILHLQVPLNATENNNGNNNNNPNYSNHETILQENNENKAHKQQKNQLI